MDADIERSPLALLQDIDGRVRRNARGLPQPEEIKARWTAATFRLGEDWLVAEPGEVLEVLTLPETARVPGARVWVLGVGNVRGNLLPIIDLQGCLYGALTPRTPRARVLSVQHLETKVGLLVDEVAGLRQFLVEARRDDTTGFESALIPLLSGSVTDGDQRYGIFSVERLVEHPAFLQVAA